jgi:thioesterase domain-containing protein/acyl carrier protein
VRASRETQSGSLEDRLINQLWTSLGVDPKTLPPHVTLGELGMESLFAVQFQQDLEREYNVKMTLNDIKNVTVKQLKDFQNGNKDVLRQTVDEVKLARANLIKIKFIIPEETHTKLNSVQTGNPVYFLPPVEGIFSTMDGLAKKIDRPVIGLNWTQDMNSLKTVKEISGHYINLLKKLSPNGNYDIVGHSLGALIAVKMLSKAPVGRAVIIDIISNTPLDEEAENPSQFFEIVYKHFMKNMPKVLQDRVDRDLRPIKDDNEKLKKMMTSLKEFGGKSLVDKDMEEIFRNTAERGKLIYSYRKKSYKKFKQFKTTVKKKYLKLNGKLFIIKPFEDPDETSIEDTIKESYNIPINVWHFYLQFFVKKFHSLLKILIFI